jgi:hypothetical protein
MRIHDPDSSDHSSREGTKQVVRDEDILLYICRSRDRAMAAKALPGIGTFLVSVFAEEGFPLCYVFSSSFISTHAGPSFFSVPLSTALEYCVARASALWCGIQHRRSRLEEAQHHGERQGPY